MKTAYTEELKNRLESNYSNFGDAFDCLLETGVIDNALCRALAVRLYVFESISGGSTRIDAMWSATERFSTTYEYVRKCIYYHSNMPEVIESVKPNDKPMFLKDKLINVARKYPAGNDITGEQIREVIRDLSDTIQNHICDTVGTDENGVAHETLANGIAIFKQCDHAWRDAMIELGKEDRDYCSRDGFRILAEHLNPELVKRIKWNDEKINR